VVLSIGSNCGRGPGVRFAAKFGKRTSEPLPTAGLKRSQLLGLELRARKGKVASSPKARHALQLISRNEWLLVQCAQVIEPHRVFSAFPLSAGFGNGITFPPETKADKAGLLLTSTQQDDLIARLAFEIPHGPTF